MIALKTLLRSTTLTALLVLLSVGVLGATPKAPKALTATHAVGSVNNKTTSLVVLTWVPDSSVGAPLQYKIYGAMGQGGVTYNQLGQTSGYTYTFTVSSLTQKGLYSFYVSAFDSTGEAASNTVYVQYDPADTMNQSSGVRFTNSIGSMATVGVRYTHTPTATSSNGGAVGFVLISGPSGMIMDSATNELQWTPSTVGGYTVTIRAYLVSDPTVGVTQSGSIKVTNGSSGGDSLRFYSSFPNYVQVGLAYNYTLKALNKPGDEFIYVLLYGPKDMSVDSTTGAVTWTPTTAGQYQVGFRAYLKSNMATYISQSGVITVYKPNGITGRVQDSLGNGVRSTITAYMIINTPPDSINVIRQMASVKSDSTGYYAFANMGSGTVILLVIPDQSQQLPSGYYKANNYIVASWQEASTITLNPNSVIDGINLLIPGVRRGGKNRLLGNVNSSGITHKGGANPQSGKPLANALVTILDGSGGIHGTAFTDTYGSFTLNELVQGTYTVVADFPGYNKYSTSIDISDAQPEKSITVTLNNAVSSVAYSLSGALKLSAEPNVVTSETRVRFTATATHTRLSVVDANGREVLSQDLTTNIGATTVTLNTASLPAGSYFLRLNSGSAVDGVRLVVVK